MIEKIGKGGFGQVFRAHDSLRGEEVAIKVEPRADSHDVSREMLRKEVAVLQRYQRRAHAPMFYGCGSTKEFNYMVMQLLSRNLSELRRDSPEQLFSIGTAFRICRQALEALKDLHTIGFVHKDVKPSNFSLGLTKITTRTVFLLDFGLTRQYVDNNGQIRRARTETGFRGTVRYAPIATHKWKETGRQDDLWSLLYMLIEMSLGSLPWRRLRDKAEVGQWKIRMTVEMLCDELPKETVAFGHHLDALSYYDEPDYSLLDGLLNAVLTENEVTDRTVFDWEEDYATVRRNCRGRRIPATRTVFRDTRAQVDGMVTVSDENDNQKMPSH